MTTTVAQRARRLEDQLTRSEEQRWKSADSIDANVSVLLGGQTRWMVWRLDSGRIKYGNTAVASAFHNLADDELGNVYEIAVDHGFGIQVREHAARVEADGVSGLMVNGKSGTMGAVSFLTPSQFQPDVVLVSTWFRRIEPEQVDQVGHRLRVFNDPGSAPLRQAATHRERELRGRITQLEDRVQRLASVLDWSLAAAEQAAFMRDEVTAMVDSPVAPPPPELRSS